MLCENASRDAFRCHFQLEIGWKVVGKWSENRPRRNLVLKHTLLKKANIGYSLTVRSLMVLLYSSCWMC